MVRFIKFWTKQLRKSENVILKQLNQHFETHYYAFQAQLGPFKIYRATKQCQFSNRAKIGFVKYHCFFKYN